MQYVLLMVLSLNLILKGPIEPEYIIEDLTVVDTLTKQTNIHTQKDSSIAMAMLLNRECPTCSYDEKVYWASCIVTGSKSLNKDWRTYIFKMKQFWSFKDKRLKFDPSIPNHIENLMACKQAWAIPKTVRFYAGKYDLGTLHYKQVRRNAVWKGEHYYSYFLRK